MACLISFAWDSPRCEEREGIGKFKMKMYVSSGIRTHAWRCLRKQDYSATRLRYRSVLNIPKSHATRKEIEQCSISKMLLAKMWNIDSKMVCHLSIYSLSHTILKRCSQTRRHRFYDAPWSNINTHTLDPPTLWLLVDTPASPYTYMYWWRTRYSYACPNIFFSDAMLLCCKTNVHVL